MVLPDKLKSSDANVRPTIIVLGTSLPKANSSLASVGAFLTTVSYTHLTLPTN